MSFIEMLSYPGAGVFYWVRIGGIPQLFCAQEVPGSMRSGRDSLGRPYLNWSGEVYRWSETLLLDGGLAITGHKMQAKGGMAASAGFKFMLRIDENEHAHSIFSPDSNLLGLLQRNPHRTNAKTANLAVDVLASDTGNMTFLDNPWYGVAGDVDVHIGGETFILSDSTDTTTARGPMTRAAYGSMLATHEATAKTGKESHATGVIVSGAPLKWEGRIVEIYMTVGRWRLDRLGDGQDDMPEFEPILDEGSWLTEMTRLVGRGVLTNIPEGGDNTSVSIDCAGLDALIDGDILARAPTATVGLGPGRGFDERTGQIRLVYIGAHNNRFSLTLRTDGDVSAPLTFQVLDYSAVSPGDTITFNGPAGAIVLTAVASSPTFGQFLIGTTDSDMANQVRSACELYTDWTRDYTWPAEPSTGSNFFRFLFRPRDGNASQAYALTTSNPAAFAFSQPDTTPQALRFLNVTLRYWTGSAMAAVPEGCYTLSELGLFMQQTIHEQYRALGLSAGVAGDEWGATSPLISFERITNDSGEWTNKLNLVLFIPGGGVTAGYAVDWFTRYDGKESFLRDLGFTENEYFAEGAEDVSRFAVAATKGPAIFRWPAANYAAPSRLYLNDFSAWDLQNLATTFAHFGLGSSEGSSMPSNTFGAFVVLDKLDLIEIDAGNTDTFVDINSPPLGDYGWYVSVLRRDIQAFGNVEERYLEIADPRGDKDQAVIKAERALYFPSGVPIGAGILQLLIGGSGSEGSLDETYDVGWYGCGLAIPGEYFDLNSFEQYRDNGFEVRRWCIRAGDKIRDLLDNECKAAQVQIVVNNGVFVLVDSRPPLESDSAEITLSKYNTCTDLEGQGIGLDRSENHLVNAVDVQGNYNPVTKSFETTFKNTRSDSIASYGKKEPMTLSVYGMRPGLGAGQLVNRLSNRIFGAFSYPYLIVELYVTSSHALFYGLLGEVASIDSELLPDETTDGQRGFTSLKAKVFARDEYPLSGGNDLIGYFAKLTLICRSPNGARYGKWSPSAFMESRSGAVGTCRANAYGSAFKDVSFFSGSMLVTIDNLNGTREDRVISSVNEGTNQITFTVAPTISVGLITFRGYASLTSSTQKAYVAWGNGTAYLLGTDRAYLYP